MQSYWSAQRWERAVEGVGSNNGAGQMEATEAASGRSRIFISYRHTADEYAVGRLAEELRKHFPRDQVFEDIASIDPGADFVDALQRGLNTCAAVLVVIGPNWVAVTDRQGRRRLDLPDDWVRHEVSESLRQPGMRVFPLLLDAEMPSAEDLPEPLRPLTRRQAFPLTGRHWANDVAQLIDFLKKVPGLAARPALEAKTPLAKPASERTKSPAKPAAIDHPPVGTAQHTQTPRKDEGARDFCLPWSSWNRTSTSIRNAMVLITDHPSLTASDVSKIAEHCRNAGKSLVVVAPNLEGPKISGVNCPGDLAIEASNVQGQPMEALLDDLASYLGGYSLLREWGFGLPQQPRPPEIVNGIVRRFMQIGDVGEADLCKAGKVWVDRNHVCFEADQPSPNDGVGVRIADLKYRAMHCYRSDEQFNGLRERLKRFGVTEPVTGSMVELTPFTQDGESTILPAGMASSYFMRADNSCKLDNAKVLVASFPLLYAEDVAPAVEVAAAGLRTHRNRLAVFAPRIEDEARALLLINNLRGIVCCLGVETQNTEQLFAVARLTGAQLVDLDHRDRLSAASVRRVLGKAREVVADCHKTRIAR